MHNRMKAEMIGDEGSKNIKFKVLNIAIERECATTLYSIVINLIIDIKDNKSHERKGIKALKII